MKRYTGILITLTLAIMLLASITACSRKEKAGQEGAIEQPATEEEAAPQPIGQPATKTVTTTTQPARKATTPAKATTQPGQATEETEPARQVGFADQKVKNLVSKAEEKITSYAFYYQTSANWDLIRDQYFIRGDKMKVKLYEVNFYNRKHYFDTVYLDMAEKTGVAFCEDRKQVRCFDRNREFAIDYNDFVIKTPLQWMEEVPYEARWTGTEQIDNRAADIVEYDRDDGTSVRLKVDAYSGVPREVWIYRGDVDNLMEKYGFRDLAVNSVKDADMQHKFE